MYSSKKLFVVDEGVGRQTSLLIGLVGFGPYEGGGFLLASRVE